MNHFHNPKKKLSWADMFITRITGRTSNLLGIILKYFTISINKTFNRRTLFDEDFEMLQVQNKEKNLNSLEKSLEINRYRNSNNLLNIWPLLNDYDYGYSSIIITHSY